MTQQNSDSYRNPLRYQGQDYAYVPLYYRPRDPTTTDIRPKEQTGYYLVGSSWVNTSNGNLWYLSSFSTIANVLQANWVEFANEIQAFQRIKVQAFVNVGTFTYNPTPGMLYCTIEVQGAGGGGGGAGATNGSQMSSGAGGAGGGYAKITVPASSIGAFQTVIVGAGGTGGTNVPTSGGIGGTSSVGSIVSATGGNGGIASGPVGTTSVAALSSAPGTGVGGDINFVGGVGEAGLVWFTTTGNFGLGGHGGFGVMGGPNQYISSQTGVSGNSYGVGGSGGQCGTSNGTGLGGGPGALGAVIITEFLF